MENVNKKFGSVWLYLLIGLCGVIAGIYGLVTVFSPHDTIPKVATLVSGAMVAVWGIKNAIAKHNAA